MLIKHELLQRLKDFGINSYEIKLWIALLSRKNATAGELADMATVPRSRSYDVLESLERKGFVYHKQGKPLLYCAISPEKVIETLKTAIKTETKEKSAQLDDLTKASLFKELVQLHFGGSSAVGPQDKIGCLKGKGVLLQHTASMISHAQHSIFFFGHSIDLKLLEPYFVDQRNALTEKHVDIKCFVHGKPISSFLPIKQTHSGKGRFILVDKNQLLLFPLDLEKVHPDYDYGVWSVSPLFASMLQTLCDAAWDKS